MNVDPSAKVPHNRRLLGVGRAEQGKSIAMRHLLRGVAMWQS
jgi:hypothetical protein